MFRKAAILFVLLFSIMNTPAFAASLTQAEEDGNPWWLWLIVIAVIALFVGFMLWWWLHEPEEEEELMPVRHGQAGVHDAPTLPTAAAEAAAGVDQAVGVYTVPDESVQAASSETPASAGAAHVERDNLTIVEGIGPAIQKVLYAAGIHTYRDLAATAPDRLEAILEEADSKLARLFNPTTWPEQAQLAADGNWEGLKVLQDRLDAGRRV